MLPQAAFLSHGEGEASHSLISARQKHNIMRLFVLSVFFCENRSDTGTLCKSFVSAQKHIFLICEN